MAAKQPFELDVAEDPTSAWVAVVQIADGSQGARKVALAELPLPSTVVQSASVVQIPIEASAALSVDHYSSDVDAGVFEERELVVEATNPNNSITITVPDAVAVSAPGRSFYIYVSKDQVGEVSIARESNGTINGGTSPIVIPTSGRAEIIINSNAGTAPDISVLGDIVGDFAVSGNLAIDGDLAVTGTITGSVSFTPADNSIALAKLVNASAQYRLFGRTSTGSGAWQELTSSANVFSLLGATTFLNVRELLGLNTFMLTGLIPGEAKTYPILIDSDFGFTIEDITYYSTGGSCTLAVKINGTDVTSLSALSVTTSPATTSSTGAKTVSADAKIELVISAPSSMDSDYVAFKLRCVRT